MTLEEVLEVIKEGETQRKNIVRLHTGDPCLYGAIKEQMDELERLGIGYESVPQASALFARQQLRSMQNIHFREFHSRL